jgi:hypothetical protein
VRVARDERIERPLDDLDAPGQRPGPLMLLEREPHGTADVLA